MESRRIEDYKVVRMPIQEVNYHDRLRNPYEYFERDISLLKTEFVNYQHHLEVLECTVLKWKNYLRILNNEINISELTNEDRKALEEVNIDPCGISSRHGSEEFEKIVNAMKKELEDNPKGEYNYYMDNLQSLEKKLKSFNESDYHSKYQVHDNNFESTIKHLLSVGYELYGSLNTSRDYHYQAMVKYLKK